MVVTVNVVGPKPVEFQILLLRQFFRKHLLRPEHMIVVVVVVIVVAVVTAVMSVRFIELLVDRRRTGSRVVVVALVTETQIGSETDYQKGQNQQEGPDLGTARRHWCFRKGVIVYCIV